MAPSPAFKKSFPILRALLTLALLFGSAIPPVAADPPAASGDCFTGELRALLDTRDVRHVRGDSDYPITFGLEIEVSIRENPPLVNDYRPVNVDAETWEKESYDERVKTAREWEDQNLRAFHHRLFEKLPLADSDLPQSLKSEGDGNFEMNGFVFRTSPELRAFVQKFVRKYGRASMQGHVAYPRTPVPGTAGYVIFESDAAQLKTFERNYARYLADPSVVPSKNLTHHSLGPLGEEDRETFVSYEDTVGRGENIGRPGNSRITNAPVFRGDSYPTGYVGHELRQFHKRYEELLDSADHLSRQLESPAGLKPYLPFSKVTLIHARLPEARAEDFGVPIDASEWTNYFNRVGSVIRAQYYGLSYGGAAVSDRFFFPLRDWEHHPLVEALPETERTATQARIRAATEEFLRSADQLVKVGSADPAVLTKFQILSARWGSEVKLAPLFERFREDPRELAVPIRAPPPRENALPILDDLVGFEKNFPNGKAYMAYRMDAAKAKASPEYARFLENSVEVLYLPIGQFGHIRLRVGNKLYGFENVKWTFAENFAPSNGRAGKLGAVYFVPKAKIEAASAYIEKFYANGQRHNVPPFDAYSPKLELNPQADGTYAFSSTSPQYGNHQVVNATLEDVGGKKVLRTPSGFEYPVVERAGRYYVQSLSCSTSATCILEQQFGILNATNHGAKSLIEALKVGNPLGTAPDALIDYGP